MFFIKKIIKYAINRVTHALYFVKNIVVPNRYPQNVGGKVFIHLGCGEVNSPEFINIDSRYFPHIHHVSDVQNLPFFTDNFADLIYTSHALEHIPMSEVKDALTEWKRVLKYDGILRISVPDFEKIVSIYQDNNHSIDSIWKPLMGGQEYSENYHYSVFNYDYLEKLLLECGFKNIRLWKPEDVENHNYDDWASSILEINQKKYPISLNIEAIK